MGDLVTAIRTETKALHQIVEASYPFNTLMSNSLSFDDYTKTLTILLTWYHQIESKILTLPYHEMKLKICYSSSCAAIKSDLKSMGEQFNLLPPENCQSESVEHVLGTLYVVLGSSNGATHILRHLKRNHPELPVSFYQKSILDIAFWKTLTQWLKEQEDNLSLAQTQQLISGAKDAFNTLLQCAGLHHAPFIYHSHG